MGNNMHRDGKPWTLCWSNSHIGKYFKRAWHKAERMWIKGHGGKERSVRHKESEVNWKGY